MSSPLSKKTRPTKKPKFETRSVLVKNVLNRDTATLVTFENDEKISLPPYLYIGEGNILEVKSTADKLHSVRKVVGGKEKNEFVKLFPPYSKTETVVVPPHKLKVTFRERSSASDLRAIKLLEQFHYRGNGLNKIVGRRTVIVAEAEGLGIVGYGVLSATVLACKPRFKLLGVNLKKQMESKLINRLARVPRIVVHPELRGLGLGSRIARHLTDFARGHWDIKGYRPVMIEVIASMTQYHKFFELAGFVNAGATEGKSTIFKPQYGRGGWQSRPNSNGYKFFGPLGPKPYLVFPLTGKMRTKIKAAGTECEGSSKSVKVAVPTTKDSLIFRKVSVTYLTGERSTARSKEIKSVFGIDDAQINAPVLSNFNLDINPGDVVLATGGSGTGKSTLLKLITRDWTKNARNVVMTGEIPSIERRRIAALPLDSDPDKPLVDQIGKSLDESIAILNSVGLAEAHLYLKTPSQISEGQKYRFSIAQLCSSGRKVWVADEFASTLDPYTAAVVAKGIRKQAKKKAASLIVAAPHTEHFVGSLLPNKVVKLRWGGLAEIFGARLDVQEMKNLYRLTVRNTSLSVLSNIRLVLTDPEGNTQEIIRLARLKGKEHKALEISKSLIETGENVSAFVTTEQGAGDIHFF